MEYMEILLDCKLFHGLSYEEIESLLRCSKAYVKSFPRGASIIQVGEKIETAMVVLKGTCKVYHGVESNVDSITNLLEVSHVFGLSPTLLDELCLVTVRAVVASQVLFLPYQALVRPCGSPKCTGHKTVCENIPRLLAENVMRLERKLSYTHRKSLRAKISAYLLDCYGRVGELHFTVSLNRTHLSEYLDVSRTALTRELGVMSQEGLISYEGNHFTLFDLEGLRSFTVS